MWKPTPKDIYKSRWKRFYKRCYRPRSSGNAPDFPAPHPQAASMTPKKEDEERRAFPVNPDGVPQPWRLRYSLRNFDTQFWPMDGRRSAQQLYSFNLTRFTRPISFYTGGPAALDCIMRSLDPGRRGRADSGMGRAEAGIWHQGVTWDMRGKKRVEGDMKEPEQIPRHILHIIQDEADKVFHKEGSDEKPLLELLKTVPSCADTFPVQRLYALCEEKEIVWEGSQRDWRNPGSKSEAGARGRFPQIDEQASLIGDLLLKDILRLNYKTNLRRHPKWVEMTYWLKKCHRQYLRRRQMLKDEEKARMGVLKQAMSAS